MALLYYVGIDPTSVHTQPPQGGAKTIIAASFNEVLRDLNRRENVHETVIIYLSGADHAWDVVLTARCTENVFLYCEETTELDSGTLQAGTGALACVIEGAPADDVFYGKNIEITSGAAVGYRRTIRDNASTTVTPCWGFHVAPAAGDGYRIFEPTATLRIRMSSTLEAPTYPQPTILGATPASIQSGTKRSYNATPSIYFVNVKLDKQPVSGATGGWNFIGTSIVFLGTQYNTGNRLTADETTQLRAGFDLSYVNYNVTGPYRAGLIDSPTKWAGWGLFSEHSASAAFAVQRFSGFGCFGRVRLYAQASWWLVGGGARCHTISGSESSALWAEEQSYAILGDWLPYTEAIGPLLINDVDAPLTGVIDVSGGSEVNIARAVIRKVNQGYNIGVVGEEHASVTPGAVSCGGDSQLTVLEAVTDNTQPDYAAIVYGGGRIGFHDAYTLLVGSWEQNEFAVFNLRYDTNPPEFAQNKSGFTVDGAAIVAADGSTIQRF